LTPTTTPVSYTHLRAHETLRYLVCRLLLEPPVEGAAAGEDSYEAYAGVASPEADSTPIGSSRYHVVVKGDTLYSLARAYYDDQRRWKDIYQANQSVIADPDLILVGQQLMIP